MTTPFYREELRRFLSGKKVILGPMAGVTDTAMRTLCLEQGADMTYTEMVSSKALSFANEKTRDLLELAAGEKRVAVQLFGHEPLTMAREAAWVEDHLGDALAFLDVNMGCPARKICTKGDGSALMTTPELAARIVREMERAVDHPVTVKFRRGYREGEETAVDFARRMEDAGASACAVHGRYAQQMYHGVSDLDVIARVKAATSIPVIGNGDIRCGEDACRMLSGTSCDSIMVARAAQGNPWIFSQLKASITRQTPGEAPTQAQRIAMARTHATLLSHRGGNTLCRMRKHAMWYIFGLPGAAAARGRINACVTLDDFNNLFDELLERIHEQQDIRPSRASAAAGALAMKSHQSEQDGQGKE